MGKYLLRFFSVDVLLEAVVSLLAETVKNPGSSKAIKLRAIVTRLKMACEEFLEKVY